MTLPVPGTPLFVISTILAFAVMWVVVPWLVGKMLGKKDDGEV